MVKSHRSSNTIFNAWGSHDPPLRLKLDPEPFIPGSPSQLDPFGSHSRPPSVVTPTTPTIILASPSTSTIHYLFPSAENRNHLHVSEKPLTRSQSTTSRQRQVIAPSRGSFDQCEKERSADRKILENAFPLPPSRGMGKVSPSTNILGPSKRISSASSTGSMKKKVIDKPGEASPVKFRGFNGVRSAQSMRVAHRQPNLKGFSGTLKVEIHGEELKDVPRRKDSLLVRKNPEQKEHTGWWLDDPAGFDIDLISPKSTNSSSSWNSHTVEPHRATAVPVALRSRSQSLSSAHTASPVPSSPVLPPPDFGAPLSDAMIPSPSFSHLDYSIASTTDVTARRNSGTTSLFSKHGNVTYPTSVGMSRGDTHKGLGSYESGKAKAREDAARRLNGEGKAKAIARSVSLKQHDDKAKPRPRSQSVSAKSIREMGISAPEPMPRSPTLKRLSQPDRGIGLGDKSIDLGGRYGTPASPGSVRTSKYPETSTSSGFSSKTRDEARVPGRPLHPAFTAETPSLSPSTIDIGLSTPGTPVSIFERLERPIDLSEGGGDADVGNRVKGHEQSEQLDALTSPDGEEVKDRRPRRSYLLAQNTFYIPPVHPKPSLRSSRSMGMSLRRAQPSPVVEEKFVAGTMSSPQTAMENNLERMQFPAVSVSLRSPPSTTPSRSRRPTTSFGLCSPPHAIDPLPSTSPDPASSERGLRSNKSSPFLAASASLRSIFGKEGFVARSLSHAFDASDRSPETARHSELKAKISSPLEAGRSTLSSTARESVRRDNRAWRESILSQAISLSISTRLNKLAEAPMVEASGIISSGSKSRLAIPAHLVDTAESREERSFSNVGRAFLGSSEHEDAALSFRSTVTERSAVSTQVPPLPAKLGRTLKQIGKEDSMGSASVYSNNASTAREPLRSSPGQTLGLPSRWSPSTKKKDRSLRKVSSPIISGPIAIVCPARQDRSTFAPPTPPLPHKSSLRSPLQPTPRRSPSRSRILNYVQSRIKTSSPPPLPSSPSSFLPTRPSRRVIDPSLAPISSSDLPPPRLPLDELETNDGDARKEEKVNKVLAWRSDVGNSEKLSRLEDMMARHVEREREALRGIAEAASPKKV